VVEKRQICGAGGCVAGSGERVACWGLGLNWVCFFGVGGRRFLRNAFWGKGLG